MSVRHALLALLSEGPKYGLQLREEFEARTGEVWPLNVGQVYTTLQRLERDELVAAEDDTKDTKDTKDVKDIKDAKDGPQKRFHLTEAGRAELAKWLRTPPDMSSPPRDELVMKILVALRVPGTDVHAVIQAHRRYLVELMQQWTRIKEAEAEHDLSLALVVDAELFRLDSVIRWLDTADGRIKRAEADSARQSQDQDQSQGEGQNQSANRANRANRANQDDARTSETSPALLRLRRRTGVTR